MAAGYPGMKPFTQYFDVKDLDVTPQLTNLKAQDPQAIMVGAAGKPCGVVIKNLAQMGFKIPILASAANISPALLEMIAGNEPETLLLPGCKFVVYQDVPDNDPLKPLMKNFFDDFKKRYNKTPDIYASAAYDAARILFEAIKQVNPRGHQESWKLRDYIEKMKNFPGVYGAYYNFSSQDHRGLGKNAVVLIQARNGKFSLYEK
jgi:branched-chain amino acid transport system substrate-binding protein